MILENSLFNADFICFMKFFNENLFFFLYDNDIDYLPYINLLFFIVMNKKLFLATFE